MTRIELLLKTVFLLYKKVISLKRTQMNLIVTERQKISVFESCGGEDGMMGLSNHKRDTIYNKFIGNVIAVIKFKDQLVFLSTHHDIMIIKE